MRKRDESGQAMVEFGLVAPLFLALLLMFMQSGFSAIEKMNAVNVTDTGARIASSAIGSTASETTALAGVEALVPRLKAGLVGTSVRFEPGRSCPSLPAAPQGTVYLCDEIPAGGSCRGMVVVQVWGQPRLMVPLLGIMSPLDPPLRLQACTYDSVFKR